MRGTIRACAFLLAFLTAPAALAAIKFPPLTGRVVDEAHVLSPRATDQLTQELAAEERRSGNQVVVAIVASLQGHEIEDYGYQLGRAWGIGQKDKDTGVILLVAPAEHKVRIEVGYGLEGDLTDAQCAVIIDQVILPDFRAHRMQQGVLDGAAAIIQALGGQVEAGASAYGAIQPAPGARTGHAIFFLIMFVIVMIVTRGRILFFGFPFGFGGGSSWGGGGADTFRGGGGSFGGGGASGSW